MATSTTTTTLGFVGLGHMGGNMAARFLAAGYTVYGESRDRRDAQDLVCEGLRWRDTPRVLNDDWFTYDEGPDMMPGLGRSLSLRDIR